MSAWIKSWSGCKWTRTLRHFTSSGWQNGLGGNNLLDCITNLDDFSMACQWTQLETNGWKTGYSFCFRFTDITRWISTISVLRGCQTVKFSHTVTLILAWGHLKILLYGLCFKINVKNSSNFVLLLLKFAYSSTCIVVKTNILMFYSAQTTKCRVLFFSRLFYSYYSKIYIIAQAVGALLEEGNPFLTQNNKTLKHFCAYLSKHTTIRNSTTLGYL